MTRTPAALAACLALLLLPPLAAAQDPAPGDVRFVVLDQFADIRVEDLALEPCAQGTLTRDTAAQAIRFEESDAAAQPVPVFPPGYASRGCGNVTLEMPIPAAADHLHVRFHQDRSVQLFGVGDNEVTAGTEFNQSVQVRLDGRPAATVALFPEDSAGAQETAFELPTLRPAGATTLRVTWRMADVGAVFASGFPTGTSYAATLSRIQVEFSGVPTSSTAELATGSSGSLQVDELQVTASVTARTPGFRNDLRFRLQPGWEFVRVEAPDGTALDQAGTRVNAGEAGYDRSKPLREQALDFVQVTLSETLVAKHGDGAYTLVLRRVSPLAINEALLPVAIALLLSPLPFALVAYRRTRAYEREAFGSFRRSARYLRIALVIALLYYLVVVGSAFAGSRLGLMAVLPLSTEAILLYVQVVVAIAAFLALALVARELYRITQPKPLEP